MTTITSMEQLLSVEDGAQIRNRFGVWVREGDHFTSAGMRLTPEQFEPDVNAAALTRIDPRPPLADGQVWVLDNGGWRIVVHGQRPDGCWVATNHYVDGTLNRVHIFAADHQIEGTILPNPRPAWVGTARSLVSAVLGALPSDPAPAPAPDAALVRFRGEVQAALHDYPDMVNVDLDEYEREALDQVLSNLGLDSLPPDEEEVTVTIDVSGNYSTYMDDAMANEVGGGATVDMERINIEWTRSFTTTRTTTTGECACGQITPETVEAMLNDAGVSFDDFDFEASCDNH